MEERRERQDTSKCCRHNLDAFFTRLAEPTAPTAPPPLTLSSRHAEFWSSARRRSTSTVNFYQVILCPAFIDFFLQ
jgi:hypothetical protein